MICSVKQNLTADLRVMNSKIHFFETILLASRAIYFKNVCKNVCSFSFWLYL